MTDINNEQNNIQISLKNEEIVGSRDYIQS